jgi:hypothetical protein
MPLPSETREALHKAWKILQTTKIPLHPSDQPPGLDDYVIHAGSRDYVYRRVPQCKTCSSPYREVIEFLVSQGADFRDIKKLVPEAGLATRSVRRHFVRLHDPWLLVVRRALAEDRRRRSMARLVAGIEALG